MPGGFNYVVGFATGTGKHCIGRTTFFVVARFVCDVDSNEICSEILMIKQTTFSIIGLLVATCYVFHGLINDSAVNYTFTSQK